MNSHPPDFPTLSVRLGMFIGIFSLLYCDVVWVYGVLFKVFVYVGDAVDVDFISTMLLKIL